MEFLVILFILVFVVIGPRRAVGWSDRLDDVRRAVRGLPRISRAEREKSRSWRARFFLRVETMSPVGWVMIAGGLGLIALDLTTLHIGPPLLVVGLVLLFVGPWLL